MSAERGEGPGVHQKVLATREFGELRYTLSLPPGFPDAGPFPVVIALHYAFNPSAPFPAYYGRSLLEALVAPALDGLGAILAAPDSHGHDWTHPALVQAVLELTDHLLETLPADRGRTALTGFSLGGIGTWHLTALAGGRFRAALPVSAAPPRDAVDRFPPTVPLFVVHSEADQIFPIAKVDEAVRSAAERGIEVRYERLSGVTHFDVPGFAGALGRAGPWLRERWERDRP